MKPELRPYQLDALKAIKTKYEQRITRQLVALPTGTGKTVLFASLPSYFPQFGKMLVLAHTEELVEQAVKKIQYWNPSLKVGREMAEHQCSPFDQVVVGSVPTLGRVKSTRKFKFDRSLFNIIVIDEAHHSVANTYLRICEHFGLREPNNRKLLLGVTATPNRPDHQGLSQVFQEIVYEMDIRKAINDGWLADLRGYRIRSNVSLDSVDVDEGDFVAGSLERIVNTEIRNELIVKHWFQHAKQRQTVVFCATIQHARELAATFQKKSVAAEAVWGDDPDRRKKLDEHRAQKVTVLTNCMVLKEGYDDWRVSCIVMARPTMSQLLFVQMIGRGTRIPEGITNLKQAKTDGLKLEKENCVIIDVVDNTLKHELITLPTLFGMSHATDLQGRSPATSTIAGGLVRERPRSLLERALRLTTETEEVNLLGTGQSMRVKIEWDKNSEKMLIIHLSDRGRFAVRREVPHWVVEIRIHGQTYAFGTYSSFEEAIAEAERAILHPGFANLLKFIQSRGKSGPSRPHRADRQLLSCLGFSTFPRQLTHEDATRLALDKAVKDLNSTGGHQLLRAMRRFLTQQPRRAPSGVLRFPGASSKPPNQQED
jgi:ATP-dependent helicase IRC3